MFTLEIFACRQCESESLNSQEALNCCSGRIKKIYVCGNCRMKFDDQPRAQVCCTGYELQKINGKYQLILNEAFKEEKKCLN